ncbi:MAG: hypothetical protein QM706_12515 [Nitrospira sp.]
MNGSMIRRTRNTRRGLHTEYDEQTFRSLLDSEHRRCLQAGHTFHVLLCRLSTKDGRLFLMHEPLTSALISAARESIHMTDQLGWFLQDLVLGALLLSTDPRHLALSSEGGSSRVRRLIENRLSPTYPSLVMQFYDYLELPSIQRWDLEHENDQFPRGIMKEDMYAMCTLCRHAST